MSAYVTFLVKCYIGALLLEFPGVPASFALLLRRIFLLIRLLCPLLCPGLQALCNILLKMLHENGLAGGTKAPQAER
jgi:hypothetical protein